MSDATSEPAPESQAGSAGHGDLLRGDSDRQHSDGQPGQHLGGVADNGSDAVRPEGEPDGDIDRAEDRDDSEADGPGDADTDVSLDTGDLSDSGSNPAGAGSVPGEGGPVVGGRERHEVRLSSHPAATDPNWKPITYQYRNSRLEIIATTQVCLDDEAALAYFHVVQRWGPEYRDVTYVERSIDGTERDPKYKMMPYKFEEGEVCQLQQ